MDKGSMVGRTPTVKQMQTLKNKLDQLHMSFEDVERITGYSSGDWDMADVSAMIGADLTTPAGQQKLAETVAHNKLLARQQMLNTKATLDDVDVDKVDSENEPGQRQDDNVEMALPTIPAPAGNMVPSAPYVPSDAELEQAVAALRQFEKAKRMLISADDIQEYRTSKGETVRFLKKSGWTKLALAFHVTTELVDTTIRNGVAIARVRATWGGKTATEIGVYSLAELRKRRMPETEANLLSTATTRATNRAISRVLGSAEVSAEEVEGSDAL